MAYREVTMIQIKEVLRQWLAGIPKKRIAAQLGVDPKTVRRYIARAQACGLELEHGVEALTDERVSQIVVALGTRPTRPPGESWRSCEQRRAFIETKLGAGLLLTKVHRLLERQGIEVPYSTLHRYASEELGFCRVTPTVAIVDGKPGVELEVDTGWMTLLAPVDAAGRRSAPAGLDLHARVSRVTASSIPCLERETTARPRSPHARRPGRSTAASSKSLIVRTTPRRSSTQVDPLEAASVVADVSRVCAGPGLRD